MRSKFNSYYIPTDTQIKQLWDTCIFSFDANVLLDLYRYSDKSRDELLQLMETLRDRIWIPFQAAKEFHSNRLTVIYEVHQKVDQVIKNLDNVLKSLESDFRQHPYLTGSLLSSTVSNIKRTVSKLEHAKAKHPDLIQDDEIGGKIADLLDGRVGDTFQQDQIATINREIDERLTKNTPPGFLDKDKGPDGSRGDALIWFQLIHYSREHQHPLIFVTRDDKEDWWLKFRGRTLQPRPELRKEFKDKTGQEFYLYRTPRFIEYAIDQYPREVSKQLLTEAKEISSNATALTDAINRDLARDYEKSIQEIIERLNPKPEVVKRFLDNFSNLNQQNLDILEEIRKVEDIKDHISRNETHLLVLSSRIDELRQVRASRVLSLEEENQLLSLDTEHRAIERELITLKRQLEDLRRPSWGNSLIRALSNK